MERITAKKIRESHNSESSYYSYECSNGMSILVEVEIGGGYDAIREEAACIQCEHCCEFIGDWDGSLLIRPVNTCWMMEVRNGNRQD